MVGVVQNGTKQRSKYPIAVCDSRHHCGRGAFQFCRRNWSGKKPSIKAVLFHHFSRQEFHHALCHARRLKGGRLHGLGKPSRLGIGGGQRPENCRFLRHRGDSPRERLLPQRMVLEPKCAVQQGITLLRGPDVEPGKNRAVGASFLPIERGDSFGTLRDFLMRLPAFECGARARSRRNLPR